MVYFFEVTDGALPLRKTFTTQNEHELYILARETLKELKEASHATRELGLDIPQGIQKYSHVEGVFHNK